MSVRKITINQYNENEELIAQHKSISEAATSVKGHRSDMRKAMAKNRLYKNYYWFNHEFPDLPNEEWKKHPKLSIKLSNMGRYQNLKYNEKWYGVQDRLGYCGVKLNEGDRTNYLIHRLIMETWKPIENSCDFDVDHRDGNKANNELDNLDWVTTSENNLRYHRYQKLGLTLPEAGSIIF